MYRTVTQLDALTRFLATWFPGQFTRVQLPEPSIEGRPVYALRLRFGGGRARRGVLLLGGTHARELMNPDAIAELAVDLFVSRVLGRDLTYGGRTWTALDIRLIVDSLDIWMIPCSNPDGREFVMTTDDMWRKNRRVNGGSACRGVDLNRNCDMLWGVTQGSTSCAPCSDVYVGSTSFSEPETRNVKHLLDIERIDCFVGRPLLQRACAAPLGARAHADSRPDPAIHWPTDRHVRADRSPGIPGVHDTAR